MTAAKIVLEDKLADTAPKKPLALTLGAAAVTLVVIIGVLAGPSVVNCFNSEDGMGVCLRGKMTDAGILPRTSTATQTDADAAPAEQVAIAEPGNTAVEEPALDVTPAPEVPDDLIAATFGLLRAEPDGSVVIAGSGEPGTEVEVYSGESLLGTAKVESSGDWVLVPDAPIPPGGTEITLAEAGKPGRAEDSFVVVINEDKSSEPLVVASTPGSISKVLQGLDRPGSQATTQLAAADPLTPSNASASSTSATATPLTPAAKPLAPTPETAASTPVTPLEAAPMAPASPGSGSTPQAEPAEATPIAPAAAEPEPIATATAPAAPSLTPSEPAAPLTPAARPAREAPDSAAQTPPAAASEAPEPANAPVVTMSRPNQTAAPDASDSAEPSAAAAPEEVTGPPALAAVDPVAPQAPDTAPSAAPAAPASPAATAPPTAAIAAVPPTIDAIEIEGNRTFFAGAGPDGATMRLYVDDTFIADAKVTGGRWLVEAGKVLTKPEQRVRVDMLQPGSAEVAARAEVNFVVDLPTNDAPTALAQAPAAASPPSRPSGAAAPAQPNPTREPTASAAATATKPPAEPAEATMPAATTAPEETTELAETTGPADTAAPAETMELAAPAEPAQPAEPAERAADPAPAASAATTSPSPRTAVAPATNPSASTTAPEPSSEPASIAAAESEPEVSSATAPETAVATTDQQPAPVTAPDIPTLVAIAVGGPDAERFASGKAIIRRGDNLWTIARRVYGEGIKYTAIYDANTGQIRDPDRIYPGQVFELPE